MMKPVLRVSKRIPEIKQNQGYAVYKESGIMQVLNKTEMINTGNPDIVMLIMLPHRDTNWSGVISR